MSQRKIRTYRSGSDNWYVEDMTTGERLCSHCESFHQGGFGFKTRRQARAMIRRVTAEDSMSLVGGLH